MAHKTSLFSELSKHGIDKQMCAQKGNLQAVEKKYLHLVSGGYFRERRSPGFDKTDYYKINTPMGDWG